MITFKVGAMLDAMKGLMRVVGSVPDNPHFTISEHLLIDCGLVGGTAMTTNELCTLTVSVPIECQEAIRLTLPAKPLYGILQSWPSDGDVTVSEAKKGERWLIQCGRSKTELVSQDPDNFPLPAAGDVAHTITLSGEGLRDGLERVSPAMAKNDARYYLNGVLFELKDQWLTLVASDGHRLAKVKVAVAETSEPWQLIAPSKGVAEIIKLCADSGLITVQKGVGHVMIKTENSQLIVRCLDTKWPDYRKIIPSLDETATVERDQLVNAVKRTRAIVKQPTYAVTVFSFDEVGSVELSTVDSASQQVGEDSIAAEVSAEAQVHLNGGYVLDALKGAGPSVAIQYGPACSAVLVTAANDDAYLHVVSTVKA